MSLLARLADVHQAIQNFDAQTDLPIIDTAPLDNKEALPGLRFLRDEVKRDRDLLRQHANSPTLSTNAPYLVAVWDELIHARQPVAIYRTFSHGSRQVKVDVVAENGARWVRVNTTKNARLMMEFHEIDSYLTSDEEDDTRPRLTQTEFDNSVLRMGRELLAAARANPISTPTPSSTLATTLTPQVTIRLTRLNPDEDDTTDPRIAKTVQILRDMGIDVQLGERSCPHPIVVKTPPTPQVLEPTMNINLDLSALIALITDISHSPLPRTGEEAHARFQPPQSYLDWKKDRLKWLARQKQATTHHPLYDIETGDGYEGTGLNPEQQSRALAAQAITEMSKGILEQIRERILVHPLTSVTFWTTDEARHRCLQIVCKIGGKKEKQRADALLGSTLFTSAPPLSALAHMHSNGVTGTGGMDNVGATTSVDTYWEHSRYAAGFLPLVPVHVYPSILPGEEDEEHQPAMTFFDALARTCTGILSHEAVSVSRVPTPSTTPTAEQIQGEIPRAAQTSLPKLTVHTVMSMLAGASRGHTTLTTNRSSVKAMLKEMRRVCGRGGYEPGVGEVDKAALWILDPRSLSEGMRSE